MLTYNRQQRILFVIYGIMTLFTIISSISYYHEIDEIRRDIETTGAYELWKPLYFSVAGSVLFLATLYLIARKTEINKIYVAAFLASILSSFFYIENVVVFGGWIIVFLFNPHYLFYYYLPLAYLIFVTLFSFISWMKNK
jgi:hypothetical protein